MKIETKTYQPQIAAAIKKTAVNMSDLPALCGEAYGKLEAYLSEKGKKLAGAPYCMYMNCNEDYTVSDVELGFPIDEPLPESGEIVMSKTYGGKALVATHKGAYCEVEKAYDALMKYAEENAIETAEECYDYYLNCPGSTPESELLTEVLFPIKGA